MYIFQNKRVSILRYRPEIIPIIGLIGVGALIYSPIASIVTELIAAAMAVSFLATGRFRIPVYGRGNLTYFTFKEGPDGVKTNNNETVPHFGPTQVHLYNLTAIRNKNRFPVLFGPSDEREDD